MHSLPSYNQAERTLAVGRTHADYSGVVSETPFQVVGVSNWEDSMQSDPGASLMDQKLLIV